MWYFLYSHGVGVCENMATDGALPFGSTAGNYTVHMALHCGDISVTYLKGDFFQRWRPLRNLACTTFARWLCMCVQGMAASLV